MKTYIRLGLLSAFLILNSEFCIQVFANDLSVDRHTLRAGETLTITISLEDAFATIDNVDVPVRNLTVNDTPNVSSEFSWINGTVVRRKVFRFLARAESPGPATVGPLVITLPDGERETFPAVALQVLPDRAAVSNEPSLVLRELLATGRDPFFVVAEVDKTEAYVGEEVVVTWWLYNAASVQEWQIGSVPKLAEFWVEEVDVRSAQPIQSYVGAHVMQRMPIRRVALFPLRSGTLPIGSMEVQAAIMRRTSSGPFGLMEGNVVDVSYSSAPLMVNVRPLPAGAAGAIVGDLTLNCSKPRQKNGGPVLIDVTLAGRGNVRAAPAPGFESKPEGDVQLIERGASLDRGTLLPSMTRRWQYVLFPARSGSLLIPALTVPVFSPSTATTRVLRCDAWTLNVTAAERSLAATGAASSRSLAFPRVAEIAAGAAVLALIAVLVARRLQQRRRVSTRIRQIVANRSPSEIREVVHQRLVENGIDTSALMRESSERGDAYRALRSLLDSLEHERLSADAGEVRRRVRELLESLQSAA
jgi:oxygen tolerance protein BatD